jgi:hypothetical protein
MNPANPFGKNRARDSVATNAPLFGCRYSRRSVANDRLSTTASCTSRCASDAGIGPYPSSTAGALSCPRSAWSDITKSSATGSGTSAGRPVTRSTSVSAIT